MSGASALSGPTDRSDVTLAIVLAGLVAFGILVQSALAGVFLGGKHPTATNIHELLGPVLILPALGGVLLTAQRLRTTSAGRKVVQAGLAVLVGLVIETGLGFAAADHGGLLALHVPVGVLLLGGLVRQLHILNTLR